MPHRTYDDTQLAAAIAAARCWRDVLRKLGLTSTSAGSLRSARRRADRLGLSYAHFTGQRRWSDADLRTAIAESTCWTDVMRQLDLSVNGIGSRNYVRAHAERLGLDVSHLEPSPEPAGDVFAAEVRPECLRDAGSLFAATWFTMRGAKVSWPLEPCRYDLVVEHDGELLRVQVKTTTQANSAVSRRSLARGLTV